MRIVVERGDSKVFDQRFGESTIYIGSHSNCQISLKGDAKVAPRHLVIFREITDGEEKWFVEPLHDQYHTSYLNGHLIRSRTGLNDKDEIKIGNFQITVFFERKKEVLVPVQVIAKGHNELKETFGFTQEDLKLSEEVIIKQKLDTFSISKGRFDYISSLTLKMLEIEDIRTLIEAVAEVLIRDFQASIAWIGLRNDEEGNLHLCTGKDSAGNPIDVPARAREFSFAVVECARSVLLQSLKEKPKSSAMAAPLIGPDGSLGMIYLESRPDKQRYNVSDLDTLVFICYQMGLVIDRLLRVQTEQLEQLQSVDQQLARKVQGNIVPWELPQWPGLQLAVLSEAGTGYVTDFYDIVPLGAERLMVLVGKIPEGATDSAICMGEISSAFRIGAVHRDAPQVLMREINWLLFCTASEPRRISVAIASINPETGEFYLCSAGQIKAHIIAGVDEVNSLNLPDNPLVGMAKKARYETIKGVLKPNQILLLSTPGIFSVTSSKGKVLKEEQLLEVIVDSSAPTASGIMNELADYIRNFMGKDKPEQDITLIMIRKV